MAIIPNLHIDEYHASDALSNSKLTVFRDYGPEHFHRRFVAKNLDDRDTKALLLGRAFDCLVFDGHDEFTKRYAIKPEGMKFSTKEGMAWRDQHADQEILAAEDFEIFAEMHEAILAHRLATELLRHGQAQMTVRRELSGLGVTVQARPDWFCGEPCALASGPYIVDLKTCADVTAFDRQCVPHGYHFQTVLAQFLLAREGVQTDAFLLVVEKKRAPRVRVKRIPEHILVAGWEVLKADIERIADRYKRNNWMEEQIEVEDIEVPAWQAQRLAMAEEV